jgi:hypothetical protein
MHIMDTSINRQHRMSIDLDLRDVREKWNEFVVQLETVGS